MLADARQAAGGVARASYGRLIALLSAWTRDIAAKSNKIDYILLSPALFAKVTAGGIDRRGVWGGRNGTLWPIFPEITEAHEAASDHAAIWADLDI